MRIRLLIVLVSILSLSGLAANAADPDRLHYDIAAVADIEKSTLRAQATLTVPASALAAPAEIHLDSFSAGKNPAGQPLLKVHRIASAESGRALRWTEKDGLIRVVLAESLPANRRVSITVEYSVPLDESARATFGYYVFMGHAAGSLWYPDVVGPGGERPRFRDFSVTLSYPENYAVLTTGAPEGEPASEGNRKRTRYAAEHVEGFSLSLGEGFVLTEVVRGEQRVVAFSSPELVDTFRRVAELTAEAIAWYRKTYGFFPVKRIGVLQGHPRWGGGFPLPNVFWIHQGILTEDFLRWITSHELGHYYWGLYVLGDEERLDWLILANGIWADQFYMAETAGRNLEEQWRSRGAGDWYVDYIRTMVGNHEQRLGLTRAEERGIGFDYNSLVRHGKGATGLFLQSRLLGTKEFLDLQRQLLADYRYQPLPLKDFVARLEAAGVEHAGKFFDSWKRGDAIIGFDAAVEKAERTAEGWTYEISVERTGTIRYPVTVEARDVNGRAVRRTLAGREKKETFPVVLQAPLERILLDPEGVLPMWNSSHPGIQMSFLRALDRESMMEPFFRLTRGYLESNPGDDETRNLMAARLFAAGRYPAVISLLEGLQPEPCGSTYRCRAVLYLARSLARVGKTGQANSLLSAIERDAARFELEDRWRTAQDEVEAASAN